MPENSIAPPAPGSALAGVYLDLLETVVVAMDLQGRVTYLNRHGSRVLESAPGDATGRLWVESFVAPDQRAVEHELFRRLLSGEAADGPHPGEVVTTTGQYRTIAWHRTAVRAADGTVAGVLCSGEDVTGRRHAETERKKMQDQLLQAQKLEAIGMLAGGIAHDFNNLLTAIKGYSQLLLAGFDPQDPRRSDIQEIETAANRATALTRQLLLFSHRDTPRMETIDVNHLIVSLDKMLHRLIGEDIRLTPRPGPEPCLVLADPGQIEQVVMNLVINARDAMPRGGEILLSAERLLLDESALDAGNAAGRMLRYDETFEPRLGEPFVRITVRDSGTGIPLHLIDQIFEPFFSTKKPGKGTGLGLSVVYGIVKQHRGGIAVDSRPGEGSTFTIYLPAAPPAAAAGEPGPDGRGATAPGGRERLLVVEDEESVRRVCTRVLRENGYQVFEAANVGDALRLYDRERGCFDLVFSDMVLPDGTGLELTRQIADRRPDLPILLTSGYTDEKAHRAAASDIGMELLHKPYDLNELLVRVRQVLTAPRRTGRTP